MEEINRVAAYTSPTMDPPYLVFSGRPNAGKSSLIKAVIGLDLATGKRPGTTRRISEYPLKSGLVVVDMPGFGRMLGASKRLEKKVNDQILRFIERRASTIALAVHVLDISTFLTVRRRLARKGFISVDVEMVALLTEALGVRPLVAANKIDKADRDAIVANLAVFLQDVDEGQPASMASNVFPVSAKTGEGIGALKATMHQRLVTQGFRAPFTHD
jgi:GTP-binding protein EngB required for normal cell division